MHLICVHVSLLCSHCRILLTLKKQRRIYTVSSWPLVQWGSCWFCLWHHDIVKASAAIVSHAECKQGSQCQHIVRAQRFEVRSKAMLLLADIVNLLWLSWGRNDLLSISCSCVASLGLGWHMTLAHQSAIRSNISGHEPLQQSIKLPIPFANIDNGVAPCFPSKTWCHSLKTCGLESDDFG